MSLAELEHALELEGVAWHDSKKKANPSNTYLGQGGERGYAPDPPDSRCLEYRTGDWASGRSLVSHGNIIEGGGGDSCEVEIAEYLSRKGHSHVSEIKSETKCGETMVRKALKSLVAKGLVARAEKDYFSDRGLPYRANRKHYRLTEKGDQWQCAMRFGYHATRAEHSVDAMSDEALAAAADAASVKHAREVDRRAHARPVASTPVAYHVDTPTDFGRYVSITALTPSGEWAGRIRILKGAGDNRSFGQLGGSASVMDFFVAPEHQRKAGRVLFQAASDYAQQQLGLPLASAVHRGLAQDTFWNRQIEHGTAKRHDYHDGEFYASRFALDYPPPARLPNPRKKKPSTLYVVRATCAIPGFTTAGSHYLTRLNDRTGQFSFTVYRDKADRFRGLDVAEVAVQWTERALQRATGHRYTLEIQPAGGGRAMARGCPAPL
jgi:DNA-binding HxlR family transcriptional regulator